MQHDGCQLPKTVKKKKKKKKQKKTKNVSMAVLLETTLGDIVIDLFTEERPKSKKFKRFPHRGS